MDDKDLRNQLEGLFSDLKEPIGVGESKPAFLEYAVEDITERRRAEEALQQRGAVLGAIALAAEKFLRPSDWEQDIQAVLAHLGQAVNVNRASIWEASTSDDGQYLISACYEWIAPEAKLVPLMGLQSLPMFRRWQDLLPRGEIIAGHVRDFSAKEQEFFALRGIKSLLAVPVFVSGVWWGFMGFDQGGTEREWTEAEIEALKTAANILGGALERRRAEEALAEERNLLRTLIDNLPDIVYAKDTESRFVIGNMAVTRLMGATTPDELLGKTDFDFYPQELAAQYYTDEQEIIQSGQSLINREEPRMDQVTGKRGWLSTTKVPLRDSEGKIVGFVGIGRDITEHKHLLAAVERRALQLQTAAEVSRAASSILDPQELLSQTVELIADRFSLYYAGLFLVDEAGEWAVLRAGTGEAGRQMLEAGHKLEVGGTSMVGWCTANAQARIALDVGKEAVRFDNPLLPNTRSELALPLVSRGEAIGALTIQSTREAAFSEEDVAVLQTLADQLANAIANARLYEALAREQYLMHALMGNVPDHIYFKDTKSRFIKISKAQADWLGLSDPAEAVGKTDFDFFTEEHARPAYEDEQGIIRTGQPLLNVEERETWPDRPDTWVLTSKMPLRDEAGNIIGTFGITRDITERKRAEEALRVSEERFALAEKGASDGLYDWDIQNGALYWSPRMKELLGYAPDELKVDFDTFESHLHPDDRERIRAALEAHLKDRGPYNVEERLRTKSGEYRWFNVRGQALWDEAGDPIRMTGHTTDITERKAAEEALAQERNLLRTLIDNLPDLVYAKDAESRFVIGNMAIARLMGVTTPDELLGKTDFDFYPQELAAQYYTDEQEIIQLGQPLINREEPRMDQVTGKSGWLSTTKVPLRDSEGKIVGFVGIGRDITEHKHLLAAVERRALQLQTAAEVSRAASSILDLDELIQQVVNLVRERFDLYYAGLFLVDDSGKWAVLRAGTGEAGRQMLEAGHKLEVGGVSMVGWCTANAQARIALDVGKEAVRFDNPLLPNTRSEMALPLISRGQVLGALDVQSVEREAFSQEDVTMLQTMADQVAVAIDNAQLFTETQTALEEMEASHRRYLREQWAELVPARVAPSYERIRPDVKPLGDVVLPEDLGELSQAVEQAMARREMVVQSSTDDGAGQAPSTGGSTGSPRSSGQAVLVVPISLRGEVIGALGLHEMEIKRRWTGEEIALIEAVADQMALAIENARLFEQTQRHAAHERLLANITTRVRSSMDPQTILQTAVRALGTALGTDRAFVQLGKATPTQSVTLADEGQEASSEKQEP